MSTTNVEQTKPAPPTDVVTIVNGLPESSVSGLSSSEFMLQNVLQVQSGPAGQPAQSGLVSITNLPASALQTFRFQ
jgi:hypothetical protein